MSANTLQTKRRWSWKVFFFLFGLNNLALVAYKSYRAFQPGGTGAIDWASILVLNIEYIACLAVGLFLANRIGLGLPYVEGWAKRQSVSMQFRKVVAPTWLIGIGLGILMMVLSEVVYGPSMQAMFKELGLAYPAATDQSPLPGFIISFYAGVSEETIARLGGFTLVAWLVGLLFHNAEGRPRLAALWLANILLALYFGFGHLMTANGLGWPMNPLVISRALVINGIAGLVFGWLYWKYGFESAILAHFFADLVMQVFNPFLALWQGEAAQTPVTVGVAAAILLTFIWAFKSLRTGKTPQAQAGTLKPA